VRGTEFSVVYTKGGQLYVKRYKGKPCVTNNGNRQTTVCLNQQTQNAEVQNADTPPAIVQQPEVFETDVEVVPVTYANAFAIGNPATGFCVQ
jgi:hypothetical protein